MRARAAELVSAQGPCPRKQRIFLTAAVATGWVAGVVVDAIEAGAVLALILAGAMFALRR